MDAELAAAVTVRHDLQPGDIGRLVTLHGELYAQECGWDWTFEAYAGRTFSDWAERHDPARDRIWIVEDEGVIVGCIAIIAGTDDAAQLRWFLLHPSQRGRGVGRRLIAEALDFARDRRYAKVTLWTAASLETAAHLYRSFGFQLTDSETADCWGSRVTQERYSLELK